MSGTNFGAKVDIKNYDIVVASKPQPFYPPGMRSSKVFTFTFWNGTVTPTGIIFPNDALETDAFGYSIALGNDVLAVGSPLNDESANNAGAVYIYQKTTNAEWVLYQKLLPDDDIPYFGANVKMYGDFLFISANADIDLGQGNLTTNAPIKVYKNEGGQWQLFQTIPVIANAFGAKMEIDNDVLVVAQIDQNTTHTVFHRIVLQDNGQWQLQSTSDPLGNLELQLKDFSFKDGVIYFIGQHLDGLSDNVSALGFNGTNWEPIQFLFYMPEPPLYAPSQRFTKIIVSGERMFLGSDEYVVQAERKFPLMRFEKTSGVWQQQTAFYGTASEPLDDYFGSVMAMDGDNLLVGAPTEGIIEQGMAYLFDMNLGTNRFDKNSIAVYPNPTHDKIYFKNAAVSNAKIYSINGSLLLDIVGPMNQLSLQNLSSGLYWVKAYTEDGQSQTFKIIKN